MLNNFRFFPIILIGVIFQIIAACGGGTSVTPVSGVSGQAELAAIAISPDNAVIAVGTTQNFTATGLYSDNSTRDITNAVTWDSSDTSQAALLSPGHIQGRHTGKFTITARSGKISGSTTLTITAATLASIQITPTNPTIAKGTSQQFTATGIFSDNSTQDLTTTVTWSSSKTGIASISNTSDTNGLAAGLATGSTVITAQYGGFTASTNLTITAAALVSLAVTPANPSIALGTTKQFTATGTFSDNSTQNITSSVTWNSTSTGVASVSNTTRSKGLATSVATGSTTIRATSGSITGSTNLTVTSATLISIAVTPTNSSASVGTTLQFTATGTYSNGATQNITATAAWTSSNTGIATISNADGSKGLATAAGAGTTTITASVGSISGSTSLTATSAALVSVSLTPSSRSIAAGATQQFTATGTYANGSTQNLTASITWTSSNPSVATVSNAGGSKGLATAVGEGTATITAASGSISGSATLTVTAASTGSASLAWVAPTTNSDGSTCTDLSGFKIYYGTASGTYT
ncbi:MAG TPA: Ig-like domain-containing protein, partial [Nitrospirota bacterium]|nr:Ig-like domain-containing protein [Nitrospirota bacterium]